MSRKEPKPVRRQHPALAHGEVLVDDRHAAFAGQKLTQAGLRIGPQQPRAHQADGPARLPKPVHGCLSLGGKGADHEKDQVGVVSAVGFNGRVAAAEALGEGRGNLVVDRQAVQGGQVGFVAEIGVRRAAQYCHGLADWRLARKRIFSGLKGPTNSWTAAASGISTGSRVKER